MRRNVIETVLGAVVLLVAIGFVFVAFSTSDVQTTDGYEVTAQFSDVAGIRPGTDVRMSGLKIGTVVGQRLDPKTLFAVLTFSIQDNVKLPADTSARIVPDGLLGNNFVSLEPGGAEEVIPPGGRIQYTQGAINVVDLLGRFMFTGTAGGGGQAGGQKQPGGQGGGQGELPGQVGE